MIEKIEKMLKGIVTFIIDYTALALSSGIIEIHHTNNERTTEIRFFLPDSTKVVLERQTKK